MDYEIETPTAPLRDDKPSGLSVKEIMEQATKMDPQAEADTAPTDWVVKVNLHMPPPFGFSYVKPIHTLEDNVQPFVVDKTKAQVFNRKSAEWVAIQLYLFFKDIAPDGETPWDFIVEKKDTNQPTKKRSK